MGREAAGQEGGWWVREEESLKEKDGKGEEAEEKGKPEQFVAFSSVSWRW